jgi:hypothetical protein
MGRHLLVSFEENPISASQFEWKKSQRWAGCCSLNRRALPKNIRSRCRGLRFRLCVHRQAATASFCDSLPVTVDEYCSVICIKNYSYVPSCTDHKRTSFAISRAEIGDFESFSLFFIRSEAGEFERNTNCSRGASRLSCFNFSNRQRRSSGS